MNSAKRIAAVIVAAGLSMGMVACSSDETVPENVHETVHDVSNSGTESTTESTNVTETVPENVHETVHDVSNSGTESTTESTNVTDAEPDLPEKVTGMSDNARKDYEKYSIPDEYIQSMLDEEIEVTKNFVDGGHGELFILDSNDLNMVISVDGEILDMIADPAAVLKGYFEPWAWRGVTW